MFLSRGFYDSGLVYVATMALCAALLTVATVRGPYELTRLRGGLATQLGGTALCCSLTAYLGTGAAADVGFWACLATAICLLLRVALPKLSTTGTIEMALSPLAFAVTAPWTYFMFAESGAPRWLLVVLVIAGAASAVMIVAGFFEKLARRSLLTHRRWDRPTQPLERNQGARRAKVSIHLPCYAEPPEIVIDVLERLAEQDYPNFEIIVCDNNTEDETLWRPVARRCRELNERIGGNRIRFFHVPSLPGAKAGALNFCLDRTAPDAELIALVDADYLARPDFLSRLAGFFDDPEMGYVQTPHDYRRVERSGYLRACYWEYMPSNKIELAGLNEYDAAYTIGTMCLIRAAALRRAGGWAEWCLTEDSEVSVRLRALGYKGIYLRESFGYGLIPQAFSDYKKQRFRWTAGPVQQLRRHWRLYLPGALGTRSSLPGWSKLLEAQRGIAPVMLPLGTVAGWIAAAAWTMLAANGALPIVLIPDAAWLAFATGATAATISRWQAYRLSGCARLADMARGELARMSLTYVQMVGGLAGLSSRPLRWRRTPKFHIHRSGFRAFGSTLPETMIALAHLGLLYFPLRYGRALGPDIMLLLVIGCIMSAARFLAAPAMALLSERHLMAAPEGLGLSTDTQPSACAPA